MSVKRFDKGTISAPEITPQGYLKADVLMTRAGVFKYLMSDGTVRRELRHPNEVFKPESMASLREIVVTLDHPPERLDAKNTKRWAVGFVGGEIDRMGDFLKGRATITDATTIEQINSGDRRESSCGYDCDIVERSGVWNGEVYDVEQTNILYNHVAAVKRGRAGPEARFKLDSADAIMVDDETPCVEKKDQAYSGASEISEGEQDQPVKEENVMPAKIKIDSIEYEATEGLAQAVASKLEVIKTLNQTIAESKTENDKLKGRNDALEAEVVKAKKEVEDVKAAALTDAQIVARADEISKVLTFSKKKIGDAFKSDGKSLSEIKREVVAKVMNSDVKEKSEAYVDGVFDTLIRADSDSAGDVLKAALGGTAKADAAPISSDDARRKSMEADKNAWKSGGAK